MSKYEKLLEKICKLDHGLRFEELAKVLIKNGYHMDAPASGSSHRTFRKHGYAPLTIPKHKPIDIVYIRLVRDVLRKDGIL